MSIEEFLKQSVFAVVGVSANENKFGTKVYRHLKRKGKKVFAVNPKLDSIDNDPVFSNLSSLPEIPDVISLVIPPEAAEKVVTEASDLGIKRVWFQPGAESPAAIQFCEQNGMQIVHSQCIMLLS